MGSFLRRHVLARNRRCGRWRGFTLVELVIVVLLMGIAAAVAVPRIADSLHTARVNSASKRIVFDLATAQARARATSSSQNVVFTVSPTASQYQLVGMPNPDRPALTYTVRLAVEPYQAKLTAVDCGGDTTIIFNGYGVPDSAGTITVQAGKNTRTISIDAETGEAKIL